MKGKNQQHRICTKWTIILFLAALCLVFIPGIPNLLALSAALAVLIFWLTKGLRQ